MKFSWIRRIWPKPWRFGWLGGSGLLILCIGLALHWPPIATVTRTIALEIGCWGSTSRTDCVRQRRQESETDALRSIEDELRELKR